MEYLSPSVVDITTKSHETILDMLAQGYEAEFSPLTHTMPDHLVLNP